MAGRDVAELETELRGADLPGIGPDLGAIRAAGIRHRRHRALAAGAGVLVVVVVVGLVSTGIGDGSTQGREPAPAAPPHQMSALAQRALDEIPGATQVSDWQVVLPDPGSTPQMQSVIGSKGMRGDVFGDPVATGAHRYQGVTIYRPAAFPDWLYTGVQDIEQDLGDDNGYPVGSTDMGILVDGGEAYLGCVGASAATCGPALLTHPDAGWVYEWGMGTDDFLKPGSDMEVFLSDDYSTGAPGELVMAGLPGTEVARVDLITTTGETVAGHVESGTVVPGQSMMWGRVTGTLASVVAYDASGDVIEDHQLKPCDDPVDCEVR